MRILNSNGQSEEVGDTCRISSSPIWSYVYRNSTGPDNLEWSIGYYTVQGTTYPYLELIGVFGLDQPEVLFGVQRG